MADLRAVEDTADRLVLTIHHAGDLAEARLSLSDPALIAWVRTAAPDLRRRDVAAGTLPRVALRVAVALGAVALILFVLLPAISDRLAAALPREQEVAFGRAVVRQMSELLGEGQAALVCDRPTGAAALERMVEATLDGQRQSMPLKDALANTFLAKIGSDPELFIRAMRWLSPQISGKPPMSAM